MRKNDWKQPWLWACVLSACADGTSMGAPRVDPPRTASDAGLDAQADAAFGPPVTPVAAPPSLQSQMDEEAESAALPGMAAILVDRGGVLWTGTYGYADLEGEVAVTPDTSFMLASVSKTFIALAAMQAVENEELVLTDDVSDYVGFEVRHPSYPDDVISPFMLLTHTSSIEDTDLWGGYVEGDPEESLGEYLTSCLTPSGARYSASAYAEAEPGTAFAYTNVGASLAAYVIEAATGVDFATLCAERLFAPLGMTHTSFRLADLDVSEVAVPYAAYSETDGYADLGHYGYPDYPSGLARSSITDMGRFARALLRGGELDGQQVLSDPNDFFLWLLPQIEGIDDTQALVFFYFEEGVIGHNGKDEGVRTELMLDLARRRAAVVLTNGDPLDEEAVQRFAHTVLTSTPETWAD